MEDPLYILLRRLSSGRKLRGIMYRGVPPKAPPGREMTWATLVRDIAGRGYFTYFEMYEEAAKASDACTLRRPLANFEQFPDFQLLTFLEHWLHEKKRAGRRWEIANARWDSGEVFYGRMMQRAKQALLDGQCPWCGQDLPCKSHKIGRVVLDGKGGLVQIDDMGVPCGSPAPAAVAPRLLRSAEDA